jgi:predicted nucleic acid-binding protein
LSQFVIDASTALFFASTSRRISSGVTFAAPALLASETLSVLHEAVWRQELPPDLAAEHRRRLAELPISILQPSELPDRSWALADELGWAKTYDAEYVALAMILGVPLLTNDRRLTNRVRGFVDIAPVQRV